MPEVSSEKTQLLRDALNIPSTATISPFDEEFPPESLLPEGVQRHPTPVPSRPAAEPPAGLSTADVETLHAIAEEYRGAQAVQRFLQRHGPGSDLPYIPCESAAQLMNNYLVEHGLPMTDTTLELAFRNLNGLPTNVQTVAAPVAQPRLKPISTGLSDISYPSSVGPSDPAELGAVANEIHNLPLDQARLRMSQLMRTQGAGR